MTIKRELICKTGNFSFNMIWKQLVYNDNGEM